MPIPNPCTSFTGVPTPQNQMHFAKTDVTFSWDHDGVNVTGFIIERAVGLTGTVWSQVSFPGSGARSQRIGAGESTMPDDSYFQYRIRANGSSGSSAPTGIIVIRTGRYYDYVLYDGMITIAGEMIPDYTYNYLTDFMVGSLAPAAAEIPDDGRQIRSVVVAPCIGQYGAGVDYPPDPVWGMLDGLRRGCCPDASPSGWGYGDGSYPPFTHSNYAGAVGLYGNHTVVCAGLDSNGVHVYPNYVYTPSGSSSDIYTQWTRSQLATWRFGALVERVNDTGSPPFYYGKPYREVRMNHLSARVTTSALVGVAGGGAPDEDGEVEPPGTGLAVGTTAGTSTATAVSVVGGTDESENPDPVNNPGDDAHECCGDTGTTGDTPTGVADPEDPQEEDTTTPYTQEFDCEGEGDVEIGTDPDAPTDNWAL